MSVTVLFLLSRQIGFPGPEDINGRSGTVTVRMHAVKFCWYFAYGN